MKLSEAEKARYSRQLILDGFGPEAQLKLKKAKVLVIGAGGLGCPALIYLAASGIGTIGIADDDRVSLSNLHRQVLYTEKDINAPKVIAAKEKLNGINPFCDIEIYNEKITTDNALKILAKYDVVLDGTDNFETRYLLNDACVILKKPLVYGAIFRFSGQVSVFNYKDGPTYRCLFPEPPAPGDMPSCDEAGVIGVLPGIVGTWQATEVIKIVSGIGEVLSGKLLTFDLLTNRTEYFNIEANPANRIIKELQNIEYNCSVKVEEIDMAAFAQLKKDRKVQLIDVRTPEEFKHHNMGGINLPLAELKKHYTDIDPNSVLVIRCKTGSRARKAVDMLKSEFRNTSIYLLKTAD